MKTDIKGLSIDPGINMGYCKWISNIPYQAGSTLLDGSPDIPAERFLCFDKTITALMSGSYDHDATSWVAVESVRPINLRHMELHFGFLALLAIRCYKAAIPLLHINTTSWKKEAMGDGKADKDAVMNALNKIYPELSLDNHNAADAVGIGLGAIKKFKLGW